MSDRNSYFLSAYTWYFSSSFRRKNRCAVPRPKNRPVSWCCVTHPSVVTAAWPSSITEERLRDNEKRFRSPTRVCMDDQRCNRCGDGQATRYQRGRRIISNEQSRYARGSSCASAPAVSASRSFHSVCKTYGATVLWIPSHPGVFAEEFLREYP